MNRDDASVIDIQQAAKKVLTFAQGLTKEEIERNEEKQSAIIYQLIIIGEATKRISDDFRRLHASVPWREMAGMRNVLTHEYDKVNIETLWGVIQDDIPELLSTIEPLVVE